MNIIFANKVQRANFPDTVLAGMKCHQAFFNKATVCRHCPVIQTMQRKENLTGEIFVKQTDSHGRYYEWTTSPIRDPSGRVYEILLLMRDITERKEYEYKLMQADRMAAVGFLAAGVAHEINNPLTSIAGFSEALLRRLKKSGSDQNGQLALAFEEYLGIINAEAYRCKEIISNLQDFSRTSSDDFEVIAIDEVIRATLSLFRQRAKDHSVRIIYKAELAPGTDTVHGKKSQLKHLFLNLLIRAFKSVEDGGNLMIEASSDGNYVKIALSEAACEEKRDCSAAHLGFTSGCSDARSEVDLSICYNIVQHHKGMMQFEMPAKTGRMLAIYFPAVMEVSAGNIAGVQTH